MVKFSFENLESIQNLNNDTLFEILDDIDEENGCNSLPIGSVRNIFKDIIRRNDTGFYFMALAITRARDDVYTTDLLLKAAKRSGDPFVCSEIAEQLLERSELEEISNSVFTDFITREYDLVRLAEGWEEEDYGNMARVFVSRQLLLRRDVTNMLTNRQMFNNQNVIMHSRLDFSALLFLDTGQSKYIDFIKKEFSSDDFEIAKYARGCIDIIDTTYCS